MLSDENSTPRWYKKKSKEYKKYRWRQSRVEKEDEQIALD